MTQYRTATNVLYVQFVQYICTVSNIVQYAKYLQQVYCIVFTIYSVHCEFMYILHTYMQCIVYTKQYVFTVQYLQFVPTYAGTALRPNVVVESQELTRRLILSISCNIFFDYHQRPYRRNRRPRAFNLLSSTGQSQNCTGHLSVECATVLQPFCYKLTGTCFPGCGVWGNCRF